MIRRFCNLVLTLFLLAPSLALSSANGPHPLDPLSWQEYWRVLEILHSEGRVDPDTRFPIVTLKEPDKSAVLDGTAVPREAYVLLRQGSANFVAIVNIDAGTADVSELKGQQPNWLVEEYSSPDEVIKQHPDFIAAMARRNIEDFTFVGCESGPPGIPGGPDEAGRRIAHVSCFLGGGTRNGWTRNIEGLVVVYDMDTREVIEVVDEGVVPQAEVTADFDRSAIGPTREVPGPITVLQPNGPGFQLDGHFIRWQNWSFHLRNDYRVGAIISLVNYKDADVSRPVLYRGGLSDIFVPYMDPGFAWAARTYLDNGEYISGGMIKPLIEGVDCPAHAHYQGATVSDDYGHPVDRPRIFCIFEREAGDMAWRHHAAGDSGGSHGRVRRDLVVRSAAEFGNYDYVFDWVFHQDGSISVDIGATGIVAVKVVDQEKATPGDDTAESYGRLVDPDIVAVNHDHFFNFRLDMDVDGQDNSLLVDRLVNRALAPEHPRGGVWQVESTVAQNEQQGMLDIRLDRPAQWRVISEDATNHVGHPTSYQLKPGNIAINIQPANDYSRQRAGFTDHQLWVTPYTPGELYAAGDFPTLSPPGEGLPAYTAGNRPIASTDIVLWYTVGMHHVVRAEDWPVMPVSWSGFEIRPFDFFNHNPAMDLPN